MNTLSSQLMMSWKNHGNRNTVASNSNSRNTRGYEHAYRRFSDRVFKFLRRRAGAPILRHQVRGRDVWAYDVRAKSRTNRGGNMNTAPWWRPLVLGFLALAVTACSRDTNQKAA